MIGLRTDEHKIAFKDSSFVLRHGRDCKRRNSLVKDVFTTLGTPRAMTQLLQTFHSELNVQKDDVEAFDFFLIAFLRLYSHDVYKLLVENRNNIDTHIPYLTPPKNTRLERDIIRFLFVELNKQQLKFPPAKMELLEPKRYKNNPKPYFELKPSPARLNALERLRIEKTEDRLGSISTLEFHFMIDEMQKEKNFNIGLKIIEVLTPYLNFHRKGEQRISFDFAYKHFIDEIT